MVTPRHLKYLYEQGENISALLRQKMGADHNNKKIGDMIYSPEALVVYPIICAIPCLQIENGILVSKFEEIMNV
ncbi:MAG: hypothetical protein C4518_15645 [Desulfobacteraceae bacterium]|nr:MAG: hypothetical protein C4518_15645 [Desulfobacteraceae bacterium]